MTEKNGNGDVAYDQNEFPVKVSEKLIPFLNLPENFIECAEGDRELLEEAEEFLRIKQYMQISMYDAGQELSIIRALEALESKEAASSLRPKHL
ncbi:MAG: hypothetical protein WBX25_16690 [Rhodomicrobium sp.]